MNDKDMDIIAERLAAIRDIIIDREGDDVQDQFEVGPYLITINVEGSGYADADDEENQTLFTLIQLEKGPRGMEELIATAVEQFNNDESDDADSFIITSEEDNLLDTLEEACEVIYRHWHWLDLPNSLDGNLPEEIDDELEDD
jgi:hypothetical protein